MLTTQQSWWKNQPAEQNEYRVKVVCPAKAVPIPKSFESLPIKCSHFLLQLFAGQANRLKYPLLFARQIHSNLRRRKITDLELSVADFAVEVAEGLPSPSCFAHYVLLTQFPTHGVQVDTGQVFYVLVQTISVTVALAVVGFLTLQRQY